MKDDQLAEIECKVWLVANGTLTPHTFTHWLKGYLSSTTPEPNRSRHLEYKELVETIEKVVRGTWEELSERVKTLEEFCMMRSK